MIVGFPGETDEDFAANLDYLPASPLTHLHVFPYSDRPGTAASAMRGRSTAMRSCAIAAPRCARSARADAAIPRVADRNERPGADARGRHAGRDRQLSEGANSAGASAQRARDRPIGDRLADLCRSTSRSSGPRRHQTREPLRRRFLARRFDDQLTAGRADVAAAALADRDRHAAVGQDLREAIDARVATAARTECPAPRSAAAD